MVVSNAGKLVEIDDAALLQEDEDVRVMCSHT
jgi:hypothetical protein